MPQLHDLSSVAGQSPWLDNLRRDWIEDGNLAQLVGRGVRGVTSNPTIFAKAISGSDRYDAQFARASATKSVEEAYWELVVTDIEAAMGLLRPVYDASGSTDGYVSVEVSPTLAHDTEGTITAAKALRAMISGPNVMIKVPATTEGLGAIRALIADGISVNVTLIFSITRHLEVIDAYLAGLSDRLEAGHQDLANIASVASFFVSRVDAKLDPQLEAKGAGHLAGKVAVAQTKLAYAAFRERFEREDAQALLAHGAQLQRPLWASTSTKNPSYPDLLYVDNLIGPDTVNTLPDATLEAFDDHGTVAQTLTSGVDAAQDVLNQLTLLGIDLDAVAAELEAEGVASFTSSFTELLTELSTKAAS